MEKLFNAAQAIKLNRLQPLPGKPVISFATCGKCRYINQAMNAFCTNCGWALHETPELLSLYNFRQKQRKDLLQTCKRAISNARTVLYIIGALCLTGIGFLFSERDDGVLLFILTFTMAALFILLARWSIRQPFTALLVSFVLVITFSTISVFRRLLEAITTINGVYTIMFSVITVFFLLRGIQFAYKADLMKEEMEIV